jgi:hypothetical protein
MFLLTAWFFGFRIDVENGGRIGRPMFTSSLIVLAGKVVKEQ